MTNRRRPEPEQIVKLLQEGAAILIAGKTLGEVLQKLEVKESAWMRWKKQYGSMKSEEASEHRKTVFFSLMDTTLNSLISTKRSHQNRHARWFERPELRKTAGLWTFNML